MLNRLEAKEKLISCALTTERKIGENSHLSYEGTRLLFEVFLASGWCEKKKTHLLFGEEKPVWWWRCVELENGGGVYDLVVWTDENESDGYGQHAGDRSLAVINVTLNGREGGQETVKLYPKRWFMERDTLNLTNQVEKAVKDVADVARLIVGGEYKEKAKSH